LHRNNRDFILFRFFLKSSGHRDEPQWQADFMKYDELHSYSNGENITIALIDSGISEFQEDEIDKSVVFAEDSVEYDTNGHGTMMLSLLRGYDDLVDGISPNATVYSYKVVGDTGVIHGDVLAKAIEQAHTDGVDLINISLGSYLENDTVLEALKNAWQDGIIIVASAGDYGANDMLFPANSEYVISVGAVNETGNVWDDTNLYTECDILAPGVSILTIDNNESTYYSTGTSQATAITSGYIALLLSYAKSNGVELGFDDVCAKLHRINNKESTYLSELMNLS
jgi:subtilisin family serine protease